MINNEIYIRPVGVLDAENVLDWENNVKGWSFEDLDNPYSILDILNFIEELTNISEAKQARWIICSRQNDRPLGAVDLTEINFKKQEASIGVLIAQQEDRGKGHAKMALQLIEKEASDLGLKHLFSSILPDNKISIRLFENCGFQKIGKTNDKFLIDGVYIEALLFEKWLKK